MPKSKTSWWNDYTTHAKKRAAVRESKGSWWIVSSDEEFTERQRAEAKRLREEPLDAAANDYLNTVAARDMRHAGGGRKR